ncbi:KilA-N domain-containing protein [Laribacter hongkongensis]|uniref:KilA domain-containing protein n=1 Tax=Laribacter hongkongensis TaxID=168471 RepID=A0A248LFN9_9NEIS|nr:KilA-N domain-containing protein [Laribacter hongkongensis]ASJ23630.1 KilA domain-containing protein [Laribacter hongkongensis]MCG9039577.1 KilA-N domain-containing protein [Laribacter hongkongensis]MCG9068503.1 KilA-N domain-containing protein [Laribacter hongkongensis]MCG9088214.1 KilA-N domain-containing protein [Laribacter hongkongensis]MCG9109289.1 KilA-N domain-containing protein [Laribacter hongkongensis]
MGNLITKEYQGMSFVFREDGYFNMTKAAQAFGKQLQHFWNSPDTTEYVRVLEETHQIPMRITAMGRNGGTWAHPKLAIRFAQWLDVRFAVWCDSIIEDILTKKADLTITKPQESATVAASQAGFGLDMADYAGDFLRQ